MADEQLSGRGLDAALGRFMGLDVLGDVICQTTPDCGYLEVPERKRERETDKHILRPVYLRACHCAGREKSDAEYFGHIWLCLDVVPRYSESIEAAMQVEDRVAEMGLEAQADYFNALARIVAASITDRAMQMFDVVHATAEQRCRAALVLFEK